MSAEEKKKGIGKGGGWESVRSRYAAAVILADGEGVNSCMNPAAAAEKKKKSVV